MSDSIKKYEELVEEGRISTTRPKTTYIYESPDGGKTVTRRPFNSDISEREVIKEPTADEIADTLAEELISKYNDSIIKLAFKKIMNH